MNHERDIETKLDEHIEKHDSDYRKLLFWIISTLIALLGASAGFWVQYGALSNRVDNIEEQSKAFARKDVIEERFSSLTASIITIKEDLQDIKRALNVK